MKGGAVKGNPNGRTSGSKVPGRGEKYDQGTGNVFGYISTPIIPAATLVLVALWGGTGAETSLGGYYGQYNLNLFTVGLLQRSQPMSFPMHTLTQLGYVHDRRPRTSYKGEGHGVLLGFSAAPYIEIRRMKFGGYAGLTALFEAYRRKDMDGWWRERNLGYEVGAYCAPADHFGMKAGVLQTWELSKFVVTSYPYPLGLYFTIFAVL